MNQVELTTALDRLKIDKQYNVYAAVASILDKIELHTSGMPCLKIAILRNFTIDPMLPVIKGEIALAGFYPQIYLGDYDTIAKDVFDSDSDLYKFQPDLIIVAQWLEALSPVLISRFPSLSQKQVGNEAELVSNTLRDFVSVLRQYSSAPVLINNFPLPAHSAMGILDAQSESYQTQMIVKLNSEFLNYLQQCRDVYLVDYLSVMARIGSENGVDERYWQIGRAPIGRGALVPYGQEYGKFFRALNGKSRKCLILDCDNSLWGGIIGEDGLEGIKIGNNYPGSCYQAFQQEILNLHDRGVIIALCSKNNESDVLEVFRTHPEMVIREENLSTWQINWDDKATNIRRIAEELNIGLDSFVFADDSQFECELVNEQLPEVEVLHLSDGPSTFREKLCSNAYFDNLTFSTEDSKRNKMYRDQVKREKLSKSANSLEDYLLNLEMVVEIGLADETTILRISQLTQKTNQFNLTTRRYTEGDIRTFVENPDADVFYIKLQDRIAEMGLIGVAIVKYIEKQVEIDTFLLSCRALSRGVEEALLATILNFAKEKGLCFAKGHYSISKKNSQVTDFYKKMGFTLLNDSKQGSDWQLPLDNNIILSPKWIKKINYKLEKLREI